MLRKIFLGIFLIKIFFLSIFFLNVEILAEVVNQNNKQIDQIKNEQIDNKQADNKQAESEQIDNEQIEKNSNDKNKNKVLDFLFAAGDGETAIVRDFINGGIDVNVTDKNGETAIYRASAQGQNSVIRELLNANADSNKKNNKGWAPLHAAVYNRYPETVRFLAKDPKVDMNIKSDKSGKTPLHIASILSENDSARFLIEAGSNVELKDKNGKTAIDIANENGDLDLVKELKNFTNLRNKLFNAVKKSDLDTVKELSKVISLRSQDAKGNTPIHLAVSKLDDKMVKLITEIDWFATRVPNTAGKLPSDIALDKQDAVLNILDILRSPAEEIDKESEKLEPYGEAGYGESYGEQMPQMPYADYGELELAYAQA